MKNVQLRNSFLLLLTAFIWGTSFVAQSVGTDYVQPFTFNGIRSLIGSLVLLPCIAFLDRKTSSPPKSPEKFQRSDSWWYLVRDTAVRCR